MKTQIEKLKKVIEVLESNHVATVEASFEYEADNIRYYNVFTRKGFEVHRYRVRLQDWFNSDTNEMERRAKCSCKAGANDILCRHIIRAAQVDTETFGTHQLFVETIAGYRAHICYAKKAAA
jgi:hypothetical protein